MQSIITRTTINTAPEKVWNILTDFKNYALWNPFVQGISGSKEVGERLKVEIAPPGQKTMTFKPQLLTFEPQEELRWKGHLLVKGIFDGEHFFQLNLLQDGTTEFIHGENFSGVLSRFLLKKMGDATRQGFEAMNSALKEKAEQ